MNAKIELSSRAKKQLSKFSDIVAQRIVKKLAWFQIQSHPLQYGKRLKDSPEGYIRFRVGEYRIIAYTVYEQDVTRIIIVQIGHRKDVYK